MDEVTIGARLRTLRRQRLEAGRAERLSHQGPPKDGSMRPADLPSFLAELIAAELARYGDRSQARDTVESHTPAWHKPQVLACHQLASDNRCMDDNARGERLGPELISAAYPSARFAPRLAEVLFGVLLFCVTYVVAWIVISPQSNVVICLVIAIFAGVVGGLRSNGRHLLWLWSDTIGRPRAPGSVLGVVPPDLGTGSSKCVPASAIGPGDWICDWEDHKRDLLENEEARERLARSRGRIWEESSDEGINSFSESYSGSAQDPLAPPEPVPRFSQVLAILPAMDGMLLELGLAGADRTRVVPNRPYYCREAVTPRPAPQASKSKSSAPVEELVSLLPRDRTAKPERALVLRLIDDGYDEPTIWNAIRACRAAGLISVDHAAFGWAVEAFLGIFKLRADANGHDRCLIALTKLGRIWVEAGDPKRSTTPTSWEVLMGDKVMGDKVAGDKYEFGSAGAVGPGARTGNVRFTGAPPQFEVGDARVLAAQLAQVLAVLEARSNGASRHLAAIEAVRSATTAAKAGDAIQVMTYLARAGKWALETATSIGAAVAAAAIQHAIGL